MQAELDDDTVMIEYSLGENQSYLWIVGKNDFKRFTLPKRSEIDEQALNYHRNLSSTSEKASVLAERKSVGKAKTATGKKDDFITSEKLLSRMLLTDKLSQIKAKRLIIIAGGSLNLIPFASLTIPGKNAQTSSFIGEKFETISLPSLTTLSILRQQRTIRFDPKSLAIIADPVFSNDDERLTQSAKIKKSDAPAKSGLTEILRDFNLTRLSRLPFTHIEANRIEPSRFRPPPEASASCNCFK